MKSSVLLSTLRTSKAYSKIGRHFCFSSWTMTSSKPIYQLWQREIFVSSLRRNDLAERPWPVNDSERRSIVVTSKMKSVCDWEIFGIKIHVNTCTTFCVRLHNLHRPTDRTNDRQADLIAKSLHWRR